MHLKQWNNRQQGEDRTEDIFRTRKDYTRKNKFKAVPLGDVYSLLKIQSREKEPDKYQDPN